MIKTILHTDSNGVLSITLSTNVEWDIKKIKEGQDVAGEILVFDGNLRPDIGVPREVPRPFRAAWVFDGEKIITDMEKARKIQMNRIRHKRDEMLKTLDVEQLRGNDVAEKKQTLRDLPSTFDLSEYKNPEELAEAWPKELLGG